MNLKNYDSIPEDELWVKYCKSRDIKLREYFVKKYSPLVKYVAGKIAIGLPQTVEFDDLVSYGVLGLLDAIERFDPKRNIKFKTYAMTRIRGAIIDELRSIDWIPRSVRKKAKELEAVIGELESKLGRAAEDDELANALGINAAELQKLFTEIGGTTIVSMNDVWFLGSDDDEISMIESVESSNVLNPDVMVQKEEVKKIIIDVINCLPEKEKQVIVLYYYEDLTLKEIGEVLSITESRVSQLHTKAILRLRGKLSKIKTSVIG